MSSANSGFRKFLPYIFVAVGFVITVFGFRSVIRARESESWPSVPGVITSSSVEYRSSSGNSSTYEADIAYEYEVEGISYYGNRVAYGDYSSSARSHAQSIVSKYPEGTDVDVYYMPDEHDECLLEPGMKLQSWFMLVFGIVFMGVGFLSANYMK